MEAAFLTVSRLDGPFGLNRLAWDACPTTGGLAGLAKTAGQEWPECIARRSTSTRPSIRRSRPRRSIVDELFEARPGRGRACPERPHHAGAGAGRARRTGPAPAEPPRARATWS